MDRFHAPILLITFNRPTHTRRVLEAVLAVRPQKLYVFQDGPRDGNDYDRLKCAEVRSAVNELAAGCETHLHTFFSDKNLGCGPGPVAAIDWFFQNVEQGVILEDDCLPNEDFFYYCQELLEKYKDNPKIGFIGGSNYGYKIKSDASYGFGSGHHQTWGWATWRRTWELFDYYLSNIDTERFERVIKRYYKSFRQRDYWMKVFQMVKRNRMNDSCWDYQFYIEMWNSGMLSICPKVNLVSNVGSGNDATHTKSSQNALLDRSSAKILPLIHPTEIKHDWQIDDYLMQQFIIPYEYGISGFKRLPYRINRKIKRLLRHQGPWLKKR